MVEDLCLSDVEAKQLECFGKYLEGFKGIVISILQLSCGSAVTLNMFRLNC